MARLGSIALHTTVVCAALSWQLAIGVHTSCAPNQSCTVIHQCAAFQTAEQIHRHRPRPCGFSALVPRVCCDAGPLTGVPTPVLPVGECGKPRPTVRRRFKRQTPFQAPFQNPAPGSPTDSDLAAGAVGGINAIVGKWPWMVLFGRWTDAGLGGWFCGGTLITDRHVLTAAHCLRPEEAGTVGARIGDNDLNRLDEVEHQQRNVSGIVRHPQYVGAQNDLAVVRLAAPVTVTRDVSPICLPPAGADHVGRHVEMAGWGLLEFGGNTSDILQEVALRVADPSVCETAYRRVPQFDSRFPGGFQGTKVCAESRDGEPRDACRGDSGGPLMVRLENDTYQLVGVVSTGVGCGNPEFPGLYTKVSAYIDWIFSQLT
ncbi:Proclotting enzyme [Amphibalanus amphitrite]|uniref:Proclotting enzyme n=1 Tax=Amphibalanus amphitrite TaxID=1232801 RepID=A0A6A4W6K5_AMPAM|nr:Proclotting enzyme [Amphibalanus amphitrite]